MRLEAEGVTLGYGGARRHRTIVDEVTLGIPDAATTVIVGPNGCGKSTLLRGMARLLRPLDGAVLLDGEAVHTRPTKEVAKVLGLMPQSPIAPEGITVVDLVGRGRQPHRSALSRWSSADEQAVAEALTLTGTLELAEQVVDELSGGQRQRVWVAMALAQRTDLLLLDEPTTFLDVAHQIDLLDLLYSLRADRGATVVMVLHDLNLAARYADHLVAMRDGRIVAEGAPADVVTEQMVANVFGLACRVVPDPVSGTPLVVPISRHHTAPSTATPPEENS
ncbi:ABC transporter ATP-binding protein [Nocardioides sp. Kera G14]|uniref:ABC transporter ATP-binding protein n=1 Tax=Nocardioides sp. Kera G14 TaxID=2884264 RepID=UPI001D128E70|nr:ABC transporter ATP-binding protein [Nocardioides sp. Kera G14]UDY23222.1 ABC transporter ATP-binding protein [Nocardioides sp. Kera G14]